MENEKWKVENKMYAYFSLYGFECEPRKITERAGLTPTEFWRKGDIDEYRRKRKNSCWKLYSRLDQREDLENHIEDVLLQIDANAEEFKSLSGEYNGLLQLVGYFYQYYPGLSLESRIVEKLGFYKLGFDCDFYYLYSEKREDTY